MMSYIEQIVKLPAPGIPVDRLTSRDKLALAIAAGVEVETTMEFSAGAYVLTVSTKQPVAVTALGDGRYTVFIGANPRARARLGTP